MDAASSLLTAPDVEQRERSFFFFMAMAIAATVLAGFGSFAVLGISSFAAPWWVHVHGVSFMAWIVLFLTQARLALRGNTSLHRQLGKIGAGLVLWMVLVGILLTPATIAAGRIPPFFTPAYFLALDWVNIVCFAALALAGLHLRKRTDWHRRLMLCATISVIAPAWGRLLVLADALSTWSNIGMLLIYVVIAMGADWFIRGRVHPAYFWGFGAIFAMAPTINAVANFPPLEEMAMRLVG
jgi:hypothetical protein